MFLQDKNGFVLPDLHLSSLPTGAVKDLVDTLGARIATGQYAVGKKIPMEPELVAEHGVSRTVVREAVKVLSGKGLVRTARRYGTHVCEFEDWNLLDPDVISWHEPETAMTKKIVDDGADLMLLIEPKAAELAAVNGTKDQLELILCAAEVIESDETSNEERLAACFAFHATTMDASDSAMLKQFRGFLYSILNIDSARSCANSGPAAKNTYLAVARAVSDRDADLAGRLMTKLLQIPDTQSTPLPA